MELDVITVAALEALNLDTDRIPVHPQALAALVAERAPIETFTWEQAAAYKHLQGQVKIFAASLKQRKLEKAQAAMLARQVIENGCASCDSR